MDLIKELGDLAVASRMRRLSDRFAQDVSLVYRDYHIDFEPRWFTVFYLLKEKSPLSIMDIAQALSITHPAVNQIAAEMIAEGLVMPLKDESDKRKRLLMLSEKGQALLPELQPLWDAVEVAIKELLAATRVEMTESLERLEQALDREDFATRIRRQLLERMAERAVSHV